MSQPFEAYLRQLQTAYSQGNATEHPYRAALSQLLETLEQSAVKQQTEFTNADKIPRASDSAGAS